jgi:hypothetical protein
MTESLKDKFYDCLLVLDRNPFNDSFIPQVLRESSVLLSHLVPQFVKTIQLLVGQIRPGAFIHQAESFQHAWIRGGLDCRDFGETLRPFQPGRVILLASALAHALKCLRC